MSRLLPSLAVLVSLAACHSAKGPELRVLGARPHEVVFVQVSNPASSPMRLSKLDYAFLADNRTVSTGEVPLDEREVPAGAAIVVEIPLDGDAADAGKPMTLSGTLTAEVDEIVRDFDVRAQIQPH
jgi:hypothetical protein